MNEYLHPYFDKAGTFYLAEAQLQDGTVASAFDWEAWNSTTATVKSNSNIGSGTLTTPTRSGYTFGGWCTQLSGGGMIVDGSTSAGTRHRRLYSEWTKKALPYPDVAKSD